MADTQAHEKETSLKPTQDDLDKSEAIAESQLMKPTSAEVAAIKDQCNLVLQKKTVEGDVRKQTVSFKEPMASAKKELTEIMKGLEDKTFTFSKDRLRQMEMLCAAEGLPAVPPFVRWMTANKDSQIKDALIEEALESVTPEDIEEQKAHDLEAGNVGDDGSPRSFREVLQDVIVTKMRQNVRSVTTSVKMTPNLERGRKYHEVPERDDLSEKVLAWHMNDHRIKKAREGLKDTVSNQNSQIKELLPSVESYFVRTSSTSQKLVMQDKTQRLVRRTTQKKARIGMTTFSPWVSSCLDDLKIDNWRAFVRHKQTIVKQITNQIASLPVESKTSVNLCAVKAAKDDA